MQIVKIVSNFLESNSFVIIDNNEFLLIDAGVEVENVLWHSFDARAF